MKKDQTPPDRRTVLRIAAGIGALATVGLLVTEGTGGRTVAPGPAAGGAGGAPGRPAARAAGAAGLRARSTAYRLQPMTGIPRGLRRVRPPVREHPFLSLPSPGRTMVLTFDDGPDDRYTPEVLDILARYDVPAMFFVCGEMADVNGDLVRRMVDDGHVVGNHTWSHPLMPSLTPSRIRDEMGRTSEIVEELAGQAPLWYRAPFGAWNRHSFEIGAELGMEPLAWTVDTLDWTEPGAGTIASRVLDGAAPGVVVLSHDAGGDRSQSVAALRNYLPKLLEAGYTITVPQR
ncbi:polysaccharide deacetylase family protein [Streptomyces sp. NPDC094448]|uniref:polysaccharide deacetylase family protein n=1 Tax=Streptomyces sp. NPDC094448 TaxID=3366063 RepID=UPI003800ACA3